MYQAYPRRPRPKTAGNPVSLRDAAALSGLGAGAVAGGALLGSRMSGVINPVVDDVSLRGFTPIAPGTPIPNVLNPAPAAQGTALVPSQRPNFVFGDNTPRPGTAMMDPRRPNFVFSNGGAPAPVQPVRPATPAPVPARSVPAAAGGIGAAGAVLDVLPRAAAYTAPGLSTGERLRIGAQDATTALGGLAGGAGGAMLGSMAGPVGTVAGGVGGATIGANAGRQLGRMIFNGDAALRKVGVDPNRGIGDAVTDLARGRGLRAALGAGSLAPAAAGTGVITDAERASAEAAARQALALTPAADPLTVKAMGVVGPEEAAGAEPGTTARVRRIDRPGQAPLFTNVVDQTDFDRSRGNVSVIGGGREQMLADLRTAALMRENTQAQLELENMQGKRILGAENFVEEDPRARIADRMRNASVGEARNLRGELAEFNRRTEQGRQLAAERERTGANLRASAYDAQQRAMQHAATLEEQKRAHDLTYRASQATNAVAREQLDRQEARDARQAQRDEARFGLDVVRTRAELEEKNRLAREGGDTAFVKKLEGQFRTRNDKGEDVPDTRAVADYTRAISASIPELTKRLRATGTPEALKRADEIEKRRIAALTDGELARLRQMYDLRERIRQSAGIGPMAGTFVDSDNLFDFEQAPDAQGYSQGLLGDRIVTNNGSSVGVGDLRYAGGPAQFLPWQLLRPRTDKYLPHLRLPPN